MLQHARRVERSTSSSSGCHQIGYALQQAVLRLHAVGGSSAHHDQADEPRTMLQVWRGHCLQQLVHQLSARIPVQSLPFSKRLHPALVAVAMLMLCSALIA